MIKLFTVDQAAEAHLIRSLLQAEGIAVAIRSETRSQVWILEDPQLPLAMEVLARYTREEAPLFPG